MWFGGSSASSARSAGDIGVHCANNLSTLACYFPADSADYAEECSKLHYSAEKRQLVANFVLWLLLFCRLGFGVLSASSARSAGDTWVSIVRID